MKRVVAAIIVSDGKLLLTRRKKGEALSGSWEFPGGKIEVGETPQASLERELKEELGLTTKAGRIITESEYHYDHGSFTILALETQVVSGELQLSVHDKADWVTLDDLENYHLAPADIPIALRVKEILNEL
jgi:8-oxo-dGTP diphosphatase